MFLESFRDMIFAVLKGTGQPLEVLIDLKNALKSTQTLLANHEHKTDPCSIMSDRFIFVKLGETSLLFRLA